MLCFLRHTEKHLRSLYRSRDSCLGRPVLASRHVRDQITWYTDADIWSYLARTHSHTYHALSHSFTHSLARASALFRHFEGCYCYGSQRNDIKFFSLPHSFFAHTSSCMARNTTPLLPKRTPKSRNYFPASGLKQDEQKETSDLTLTLTLHCSSKSFLQELIAGCGCVNFRRGIFIAIFISCFDPLLFLHWCSPIFLFAYFFFLCTPLFSSLLLILTLSTHVNI